MRHERLRSRDEERYLEAVDEARENVLIARDEYRRALDRLEDLEEMVVGPESAEADGPLDHEEFYQRRRRRAIGPR